MVLTGILREPPRNISSSFTGQNPKGAESLGGRPRL
jgi:hypothetical protein